MADVGAVVRLRCQAHFGVRYASNEEAERLRCTGQDARYLGTSAWVSQNQPDLPETAQRMPEGQGHVYQCTTCNKSFFILMGAKF